MKSNILLQPVISEKSYAMANALNKYEFLVGARSEKIEIAKEVEKRYKVKVLGVTTIARPGKLKRDWKTNLKMRKQDAKKAVVTLKKGDKIQEFLQV